jgi:hypothetical protein
MFRSALAPMLLMSALSMADGFSLDMWTDGPGTPGLTSYRSNAFDSCNIPICTDIDADTWHVVSLPFEHDGWYPSLAINGNGYPCIAYTHYNTAGGYELCYSEFDGAQWMTSVVDAEGATYPSLALSADGSPVISAWASLGRGVNLYSLFGGAWGVQSAYVHDDGDGTSLGLDGDGMAHIAALVSTWSYQTWFIYAEYDGASWQVDTLSGNIPDLCLDSSGAPYISHRGTAGISYLYCTFEYAGEWWTTTIGEVEYHNSTSICMAADDVPHVATCGVGSSITHVWDAGPAWLAETVPGTDQAAYPDVACGPDGEICIAFQEESNRDLRASFLVSGEWTTTVVDWEGLTGFMPSVAIDGLGRTWIAYMSSGTITPDPDRETSLELIWFGSETGIAQPGANPRAGNPEIAGIAPNPSCGSMTVALSMPGPGFVTITVHDLSGRIVHQFPGEYIDQGEHQVQLGDPELEPGVYFLRMSSGGSSEAQRFVVVE